VKEDPFFFSHRFHGRERGGKRNTDGALPITLGEEKKTGAIVIKLSLTSSAAVERGRAPRISRRRGKRRKERNEGGGEGVFIFCRPPRGPGRLQREGGGSPHARKKEARIPSGGKREKKSCTLFLSFFCDSG